MTSATEETAVIYDFAKIKAARCPQQLVGYCDNLSFIQTIDKLTDRIVDQYNTSVAIERQIDEDEAGINEHIIGLIRDKFSVTTEDIHHRVEVSFNIRLTQQQAVSKFG